MEPHVQILCDFRDRYLQNNFLGKAFIRFYNAYSPPLARFIAHHNGLRAFVRNSLLPAVVLSWIALQFGPSFYLLLLALFVLLRLKQAWKRDLFTAPTRPGS
jgi:hypothetical protein